LNQETFEYGSSNEDDQAAFDALATELESIDLHADDSAEHKEDTLINFD
jgi:hypothetical protein